MNDFLKAGSLFRLVILLFLTGWTFSTASAQVPASIRGNIYDEGSGEAVAFGSVQLAGTDIRTITDLDGFFVFTNLAPGTYTIEVTYIGYDTLRTQATVTAGQVKYLKLYLAETAFELETISVSASQAVRRNEVNFSKITVTPKQIQALPSVGGEPDVVQYLQVLPGVISTGDQGGQLYIRGGSPVQNRMMIDGMTIYNPFHSIGLFSVFETEAIKSADVLTGGFGAEHGGRISAIVDLRTRDGDKSRYGGLVSASPFQMKGLIEGPIIPFSPDRDASASFLLTAKHSYLDRTSKSLYQYATDGEDGLPFSYTDFYGKMSFATGGGSKLDFFGFSFTDGVDYSGIASQRWTSGGGGMHFKLVPQTTNMVLNGTLAYSKYDISLTEADGAPRRNTVGGFNALLNFTNYGHKSQFDYGFELNGFSTDFIFRNFLDVTVDQKQNTTEIAGYATWRQKLGAVIIEPGVRVQFYASLGNFSLEPRLALKSNFSDDFRFKFAFGTYSQNLISSVNERDVVNLFVAFLSGPESANDIYDPVPTRTESKLQRAWHVLGGFEIDMIKGWEIDVEAYYKGFTQLLGINREKYKREDPDFAAEIGSAYGIDLTLKRAIGRANLWMTYSLGYIDRNDGEQEYPPHFERRHNVNLLATWRIGRTWELGARWNYGSGFPFTQTQGFYGNYDLLGGIDSDVLTGNPDLGIIYASERNGGKLPDYHRLDLSLKKWFDFSEFVRLEIMASVTNAYNRDNIFYFDRVRYTRVNQLPIMPALTVKLDF